MSDQKIEETKISNVEENEVPEAQTEAVQDLILGKFKSVDDLKTAYLNLQKQQGNHSSELGELRKWKQDFDAFLSKVQEENEEEVAKQEYMNNYLTKYDNENYFQNEAFKKLYSSAFNVLGTALDTDGFVQQLEDYVLSRIALNEQLNNAQAENKKVTDSLDFSKGESKSSEKKLRFQDIPADELEKYIAKYV